MRAIFTADWHLRKDRPRCRTDKDWMETQAEAIRYITREACERDCRIYVVGDLFHRPREPYEVVDLLVQTLIDEGISLITIPGNHDLLYHQFEEGTAYRMATLTPAVARMPKTITEGVGMEHILVFQTKADRPHPDAGGITADELLDSRSHLRWIITGDNHQSFHYERDGRHVLNPGCLIRQNANEIEYTPRFAYVDTECEPYVEWVSSPGFDDDITDLYLEKAELRDERIEAFVERIRGRGNVTLSFRENVKQALTKDIPQGVQNVVIDVMEEIR